MRHLNFSGEEILETITMVRTEQLDIRTITIGISLLDCVSEDPEKLCRNVFEKIEGVARNLRRISAEISDEFGLPIINNRIAVTPVSLIAGRCGPEDLLRLAQTLDRAAHTVDVDFIGGFSAHVEKGMTTIDENLFAAIPQALAATKRVCASVNVGSTRAGLNMDAIAAMGGIVKRAAELTADTSSIGCAKLVVLCNAVEDNPFMAGAFHGASEPECTVNVGVSGPGVVLRAIQAAGDADFGTLASVIRRTAFKITRAGELVARTAAARLGLPFGIVYLSLAPTPAEGDSVARILEEIGLDSVGTHGSTAALALLNDAVKKGGAMASSHVGGLSGALFGDKVNTSGFLAGLQLGYDWQINPRWVVGVVADVNYLDGKGTFTCMQASPTLLGSNCEVDPRALASVAGHLGYLLDPLGRTLLYGKAGGAWTNSEITVHPNNSGNLQPLLPATYVGPGSATQTAPVPGAEWWALDLSTP
jgi:uncharacterized protein (UPF0210 family)